MQTELRDEDVPPGRMAELLTRATALLGSCNTEIREADAAYAQVLLGCMNSCEAANRARIQSEITPEYARKAEARHVKEELVELTRSLKYALRSAEEEMRLSR